MPTRDMLDELEMLLRAQHSLLVLETVEAERAEALLAPLAQRAQLTLFAWSRTRGLRRADEVGGTPHGLYGTVTAAGALGHIAASKFPGLYFFDGLEPDLDEPQVGARLKEVVAALHDQLGAVVLIGDDLELPPAVRPYAAGFRLPAPRPAEYQERLVHVLQRIRQQQTVVVDLSEAELERLIYSLRGLTLIEAERVFSRAILHDGRLHAADLRWVNEAKRQIIQREGLLEYYPVESTMADIADLEGLKGWLRKRRNIIDDPERARAAGLEFPKGVLLVGIPGTGKSLCAKAVAMEWRLPLLKLDPSSLYDKYVGQTEKNFRRAMRTAERMAPLVLWIDEVEKAFASGGGEMDAGLSTRVLGTFLSWLQDRSGDVFVVATANDVSRLPAELLRKGRFDELFFVDLPDLTARRALFEIHLTRRGQEPGDYELDTLAEFSRGFSGADVEQVVASGLYTAFDADQALSTTVLLSEIAQTRPLSQTMPERIAFLRDWARDRTVPAN